MDKEFLKAFESSALRWTLSAGAILAAMLAVLLLFGTLRETRHLHDVMREKGEVLVNAFEAACRASTSQGLKLNVQSLVEQTANQSGINCIAIVDMHGRVLAHKNPLKLGSMLLDDQELHSLDINAQGAWRMVTTNGIKYFQYYRIFNPEEDTDGYGALAWPLARQGATAIFVDMVFEPLERLRQQEVRNFLILGLALLLAGLTGVIAMYWAQRSRLSRRLLQEAEAFSGEVVRNLPVGLLVLNHENRLSMINPAAARLTDLRDEHNLGRLPSHLLPAPLAELFTSVQPGAPILEKELAISFDAVEEIPVSVSVVAVPGREGQVSARLCILRDLREVKELEAQIRRKEKLAAIGSLAAGVAHELRNPLSSIKGYATYFRSCFPEDSEEAEAASILIREVERLNRAIGELLDLARPTNLTLGEERLEPVLERSLRFIRQDAAAQNVELRLDCEPDLPPVLLDADRFSQALLNLYLNALQSMENGGKMLVRAERVNGQALVTVEDSGPGIPPERQGLIFDPYFTTKSQGTGLGLALVLKIIEGHGGQVLVSSKPGEGARFTIRLPILDQGGVDAAERADRGRRPGPSVHAQNPVEGLGA